MINSAFAQNTMQNLDVKVYPDIVPQSAQFPCIIYSLISRPSLQGVTQRLPFEIQRIQVVIYAKKLNEVEKIAEELLALWINKKLFIDDTHINQAYMDADTYEIEYYNDNIRPLWGAQFDLMFEIVG